MQKKGLVLVLFLSLFISLAMAGCSSGSKAPESGAKAPVDAGKTITLQYAHPTVETSNTHRLGLKIKEELEKRSNGRIKVQVLAQFAGERELLESLQRGDVALTLTSAAPLVMFEPKMAVFDLPFLFTPKETVPESMKTVFKVFDTKEVKDTLKYLDKSNLKGMGYLGLGFRVLTTKKPIQTLDDLKGQKIRTMENKNHMAAWQAISANPTPMAFTEVFTALEQGTVNGQENPYDIINSSKFYEVQKYATNLNMIFNTTVLSMSKPVFEKLPADLKPIVEESIAIAIAYARADAIDGVDQNIKNITAKGMTIVNLSQQDREKAIALTKPVWDKIRKDIGNDIVDNFVKAVASVK